MNKTRERAMIFPSVCDLFLMASINRPLSR